MGNAYFFNCDNCDKRERKRCEKRGKPCSKMERYLRRHGIFDSNWIRPRLPMELMKPSESKWREVSIGDSIENYEKPKYLQDNDLEN